MPRFTTGHSFDDIDNLCLFIYFFFFFGAAFFLAAFLVAIVVITPFVSRFCMAVIDHATASIFLIAKLSIQNDVLGCDHAHQVKLDPGRA